MIVEERIYTLHVGKVPDYLALYEAEGFAVQTRILGNLLGYFQVEFGPQNQIVHLWSYSDLADRQQRRKALQSDPDWAAYVRKIRPLVLHQENKLLVPLHGDFDGLMGKPWSSARRVVQRDVGHRANTATTSEDQGFPTEGQFVQASGLRCAA